MKQIKKKLILMLMVVGGFVLTGCGSHEEIEPDVQANVDKAVEDQVNNDENLYSELPKVNLNDYVSEDKSIFDLVTKTYTDEQLKTIVAFSGNLSELNDIYPIECIRVSNDEVEGKYKVTYIGEQCYAFLWFDENQEVFNRELYNKSPELRVFEQLGTDLSFDDIKKIDPNGNYMLFCLGVSDFKTSYHCTEDGYFVTINYDDNYKIVDIQKELI